MNAHYFLLFSSRVSLRVRIRFSVWLVSRYAQIFVGLLLQVVIVSLPTKQHAIFNLQLTIGACPTYSEILVRGSVIAPFVIVSVVVCLFPC